MTDEPTPEELLFVSLNELVEAIEKKAVKIDGPTITGGGDPEIGYESWPWADEWLHYAKRAIAAWNRRPAPTGMVDQGALVELISRARWKAWHVPSPVVSALLVELADALTAAAGSMGEPALEGDGWQEGIEAAAKLIEGKRLCTNRYLTWPWWGTGNQHEDSPIANFAAKGAAAIRTLLPPPAAPKPSADPSRNGGGEWWP